MPLVQNTFLRFLGLRTHDETSLQDLTPGPLNEENLRLRIRVTQQRDARLCLDRSLHRMPGVAMRWRPKGNILEVWVFEGGLGYPKIETMSANWSPANSLLRAGEVDFRGILGVLDSILSR